LIVVGATSERDAGFTGGLTPDGQTQLQAGIQDLLPVAGSWPPMERWWGFRPCTPDEGPLLGRGPIQGLWLACGHHRNGVLLAAITADLLANAMTDDRSSAADEDLIKAFRWERFQRPQQNNV
jgi:glycine oxidase